MASYLARPTRVAAVGGPVLLAVYGLVRLLPGSKQPGAGWLVGHAALLAGLLLFGVVLAALYRVAARRRPVAALALGTALAGLAASLGQVGVDLYVGAVAADKAAQQQLFERIQDRPGVVPALYSVGPLLFYVGLLALLLAAVRLVRPRGPLLMLAGTAVMAADLDLMALGALLYLAALAPLAGRPAVVTGRPAVSAGA
ncbi:hypothetical protein AB0K43_03835 [Kitasatospora sp. NPDC049258]|uniref:hypothetical protein n=1 Tax=Kitasatospora sp. NPDC049258 TaxID=3155394 RepID=UPI0034399DC9